MFRITSQNPMEISQTSSQNTPMQMREQAHKTLKKISRASSQNLLSKSARQAQQTPPKQVSKTSSHPSPPRPKSAGEAH